MKKFCLFYTILLLFSLMACSSSKNTATDNEVNNIISTTKKDYIPDGRLCVYNIKAVGSKNDITVKGYTMSADAKKALLDRLKATKRNVKDSITWLPDAALGDRTYVVVD